MLTVARKIVDLLERVRISYRPLKEGYMYYTIYKVTNLINEKVYIGKHKTTNLDDNYLGSGTLILRAIRKYGEENFRKEILYIFDNEKDMNDCEKSLVDNNFINSDNTYNLTCGGHGSWEFINKNGLNNINNNSRKAGLIHAKRMKDDPEYRKKTIDTASKTFKQAHTQGKIKYNTFTGKKHTEEAKKKMSESSKKWNQNKCWIFSRTENRSKFIDKSLLSTYLNKGWVKGRK